MQTTILIVDDEKDLADTISYNLGAEGFQTQLAFCGKDALEFVTNGNHLDLIILDLMLPDISGIEICRKLKSAEQTKDIPIIMLTAKGEEIDRIVGFEVGADDYVIKPFSVRELLLRVKAILRRTESNIVQLSEESVLSFGVLKIDLNAYRVWIEENEIQLTALELKLLSALLSQKGRGKTREALLSEVWGINTDVTTRTVDTHVKRLREKLGPAAKYIETLRGIGYRFSPQLDSNE